MNPKDNDAKVAAVDAIYPTVLDHWYQNDDGVLQVLMSGYLELWAVHRSGVSALYLANTPRLSLHGHFIEMTMGLRPMHVYRGDKEDIHIDEYIEYTGA